MKRNDISYEIIDVSAVTNVKFYTSVDPGSYIPTHWHRAVEIIYMQEGSLDVTIESKNFTIYPEDCILINANVPHSTKCVSPNKAIVLQIPLDFMEKYIPNIQQLTPPQILLKEQKLICCAQHWNKCRLLTISDQMVLSCVLTVSSLSCFFSFIITSV